MVTEYQKRLLDLGNVEFENIEDSDVITFETWDQGFGPRSFFYLYSPKGELKDVQCGKFVPQSENKMSRPLRKRDTFVPKEQKEKKVKVAKVENVALKAPKVSLSASKSTPKVRKKMELSQAERDRRAENMRQYWIKRKAAKSNASA